MRLRIFFGVTLLAGLCFFAFTLFGPNARVRISPQTTFITTPLAADGYPDYVRAMMDRQREGVTPENNGAVLMWRALGPLPSRDGGAEYDRLFEAIGVEREGAPQMVDLSGFAMEKELANWIGVQFPVDLPADSDEWTDEERDRSPFNRASYQFDLIRSTAWKAEDLPPVAKRLAENEQALDLLVAGAERPRFYSPSPNALGNGDVSVGELSLPHTHAALDAARALAKRATLRVGEGEFNEAWRDCRAIWRLGSQIDDGPTLWEKYCGMSVRRIAYKCTQALLQAEDLPVRLAERILSDLQSMEINIDVADVINHGERYAFLDGTLRFAGRHGGFRQGHGTVDEAFEDMRQKFSIDVNLLLANGNASYNRLVAAMRIKDRQTRLAKVMALEKASMTGKISKAALAFRLAASRDSRSELISEVLSGLSFPPAESAIRIQERDRMVHELMKVVAAIALYRARVGEYPEELDEIAGEFTTGISNDLYTGKPLHYERRGQGYVLYSVYENGVDDGGDDWSDAIVDGEWVDPVEGSSVLDDSADFVIRVPTPEWRAPTGLVERK